MLIWVKKVEYYKTWTFITTYKNGRRSCNVWLCRIEKDIDTKNIWVSNKICSGKISINPLLVACMMNKVKPLHIMLPKVSTYVKSYDGQTKWIYFLIEFFDWTKYNAIWDKVNAYIQKEFDSKPVYDKKSYGDEVTDFYNKKISMVK